MNPLRNYIAKYKFKTVEAPIVNMHGSLDETPSDGIIETQKLVISTKDMPKKDWLKTRIFASMSEFLFFNKILQIPILLLYAKHPSISYKKIIQKFIEINDSIKFPTITYLNKIFYKHALDITKGKAEFIYSDEWLQIYWPPGEYAIIKLFEENIIEKFYKESADILCDIMNNAIFNQMIEEAAMLNYELIKKPMAKGNINIIIHYNIHEFYYNVLKGNIIEIESGEYNIKINRSNVSIMDWQEWARKVLWYGHRKGDYLYSMNSLAKGISDRQ